MGISVYNIQVKNGFVEGLNRKNAGQSLADALVEGTQFLTVLWFTSIVEKDVITYFSETEGSMNASDTSNTTDTSDTLPSITVSFPDALRKRVGNRPSVMASGRTIREIIDALEQDFPGIRFNLCYETGELRPYVNIFLNHQNIRYLQGLDTPVTSEVRLHILQSVAGG